MFSPEKLACGSCQDVFGQKNKPLVLKCGHQYCEECIEEMKEEEEECRKCGKEISDPVVNYSAVEVVEHVKQNIFQFYDRVWYDEEKLGTGLSSICNSFSKNLRFCLTCGLDSGLLEQGLIGEVTTGRLSGMEIFEFLRLDAVKFCGDCVLDEKTEHTGHRIMQFDKIADKAVVKVRQRKRKEMYLVVNGTVRDILEDIEDYEVKREVQRKVRELRDNMWLLLDTIDRKHGILEAETRFSEVLDPGEMKERKGDLKKRQFEEEKQRHRIIRELETLLNIHCGTTFETKLEPRYEDVGDLVEEFEKTL